MSASEIAEAITQPAASVGVEVEPALVNGTRRRRGRSTCRTSTPSVHLTELFERSYSGRAASDDTGGLSQPRRGRGRRGTAGRGGRRRACPTADRDLARRVFLRLVTVDDDNTRQSAPCRSRGSCSGSPPMPRRSIACSTGSAPPASSPSTTMPTRVSRPSRWPTRHSSSTGRDFGIGSELQATPSASASRSQLRQRCGRSTDRDDSDLARGLRLESALELVAIDPDALDPLEREFVAASDRLRTAEADAQKERAEREPAVQSSPARPARGCRTAARGRARRRVLRRRSTQRRAGSEHRGRARQADQRLGSGHGRRPGAGDPARIGGPPPSPGTGDRTGRAQRARSERDRQPCRHVRAHRSARRVPRSPAIRPRLLHRALHRRWPPPVARPDQR